MLSLCFIIAVLSFTSTVLGNERKSNSDSLPIVHLGYERHQAISFNSTGGFYNFSNIRYAQPPVGELRFAAPVAVTGHSDVINNGSVGRVCAQSIPAWPGLAAEFVTAYLTGQPFNVSTTEAALAKFTSGPVPTPDPRTTEDCLFLDVYSPKKVFDQRGNHRGAPVLAWIYGGGFTAGEKNGDSVYNPAGLIRASQVSGGDDIVYVALNYRLGAFGWLGGPTLQSNGTANAGLYDQRLALEWVQKNIHHFGGDPKEVTVIGESAGGASIMHQITAFGGLKSPTPFKQAILQSPAWEPMPSHVQQENTFQSFLKLLNVSSIQEARQLPSASLIQANALQVIGSVYGAFTYGPVVDGLFAPDLPGKLLLQGSYDKNLNVMVGHNANEGLDFADPRLINNTFALEFLATTFPGISPAAIAYIDNVLYPKVFDGSYGYKNNFDRWTLAIADSSFTCNTNYLDRAFNNKTYAYQFSVFPGLHGQDISYTFYNGPSSAGVNSTVAIALQEYITSFAIKGVPSGPGIPMFPLYGTNATEINLSATSISEMRDPTSNSRCLWWQKALYF
ncbi:hypothetical protein MMC30_008473 [Trapelia coarctata]|nr:hypothetical protein [Trapelia coarctata]